MDRLCWCGQDAGVSHAHGGPVRALGVSPAAAAPPTAKRDTSNKYSVARNRERIFVMCPPRPGAPLTPDEALALAAWLIAMATDTRELQRPLDAISSILDEITA